MAEDGGSWASTFSGFLGTAGLVAGVLLFVFGFVMAKRGVSIPLALTMLGLAGLIGLAVGVAVLTGMAGTFSDVARLGPTVTPDDMAGGMQASLFQGGRALVGFVLGMTGALRALAAAWSGKQQAEHLRADQPSLTR